MKSLVSDAWSGWSNEFLVSQQVIDQFAALSGDDYWIHTDPVRAKAESPSGTTIAHGMLVQSARCRLRMPPRLGGDRLQQHGQLRQRPAALCHPAPSGCRDSRSLPREGVEAARSGVQLTLEIAIHVVGSDRPSVLNDQVILTCDDMPPGLSDCALVAFTLSASIAPRRSAVCPSTRCR